jgi:hypothetical protein
MRSNASGAFSSGNASTIGRTGSPPTQPVIERPPRMIAAGTSRIGSLEYVMIMS